MTLLPASWAVVLKPYAPRRNIFVGYLSQCRQPAFETARAMMTRATSVPQDKEFVRYFPKPARAEATNSIRVSQRYNPQRYVADRRTPYG